MAAGRRRFGVSRLSLLGAVLSALVALPVLAGDVTAPLVHAQDRWLYKNNHEVNGVGHPSEDESTVVRVSAGGILMATRTLGSNLPPKEQLVGSDWSRSRSVNGVDKVVNRPLAFPLSEGKNWVIDYREDNPNREHKYEIFHSKFVVTGWEQVTVPAGTFNALKIESDGQWTAENAPAVSTASTTRADGQGATAIVQANKVQATIGTGRTYKAFWYVPEVKRWVKSVEEYYGSNEVLTSRYSSELESYTVAQ